MIKGIHGLLVYMNSETTENGYKSFVTMGAKNIVMKMITVYI
jgi:hypothetical protein